jgi:hypothetical protein
MGSSSRLDDRMQAASPGVQVTRYNSTTPVRAPEGLRRRACSAFRDLHTHVSAQDYRGYEFDDMLASPLMRRLAGDSLFRQRVVIQIGERAPVNIRPFVFVPRLPSSKARGFFARGYLRYFATTEDLVWLDAARSCLDWVLDHASPGYKGLGWGNQFDFASRAGFFPKGLPTVVWTAHIASTLLEAHRITSDHRYRAAFLDAATFISESLGHQVDDAGICFNYSPGIPAPIHNSNLLAAATLAQAAAESGNTDWGDLASRAYAWSLASARRRGAWQYGVGPRYAWVDNFHTAYVIESLVTGHELLGDEVVPSSAIGESVAYWVDSFFLPDGTPRYYDDRTLPIDIQCAAQAIETAAVLSHRFPWLGPLADRVLSWTLGHMRKPNGAFGYQKRRWWRNDLESIHWGQATMLSALGAYCACRA